MYCIRMASLCESACECVVCTNKDTLTAAGYDATEHAPYTAHPTGVTADTRSATRVLQAITT